MRESFISALKEIFERAWGRFCKTFASHKDPPPADSSPPKGPGEQNASESVVESNDEDQLPESETPGSTPPIEAKIPRIPSRRGKKSKKSDRKPYYRRKPELVCIEKRGDWQVAVEIPSGVTGDVSVLQGAIPLSCGDDGRFLLNQSIHGSIQVNWPNEPAISPPLHLLDESNPSLIFKTRMNWEGVGRKHKHIKQRGCYLVFTNSGMNRKSENPPIEAQSSFYKGVEVHYFSVESESSTEDGFHEIDCFSPEFRFFLDGEDQPDGSGAGMLFLHEPPLIRDNYGWEGVSHVVIGKEIPNGEGDSPMILQGDEIKSSKERMLRDFLKKRRGGWFFIRIYDEGGLIHSDHFRFLRGFRGMKYDYLHIPNSPRGYQEVNVQFIGECSPQLNESNRHVIQNGTMARLAPHQDADKTTWKLSNGGESIDIVIRLDRIWWRIVCGSDDEDISWRDTPLEMKRENFRATMRHELQIWLPKSFGREVGVDFPDQFPIRKFQSKQGIVCIPLREFSDNDEIGQQKTEARILLWISEVTDGQGLPVVVIPADQIPLPPPQLPSSLPLPQVRCRRGHWRAGKGYSPGELKESGVAKNMTLRVDKRRRSVHLRNIKALRTLKGGEE